MKEITVETIDNRFDEAFEDIDVSENDKSERNSVSLKSIIEAYEESRQY